MKDIDTEQSCRISPPIGADALEADKKASTSRHQVQRPDEQYEYMEEEKKWICEDLAHLLEYGKIIEAKSNLMFNPYV